MATITIPKKITRGAELVVIPRKEYEKLVSAKKIVEFTPTLVERNNLARARKNYEKGNFLTLNELKSKLGIAR
jgi:hypothetical protein